VDLGHIGQERGMELDVDHLAASIASKVCIDELAVLVNERGDIAAVEGTILGV
jgi:hypothetical protein